MVILAFPYLQVTEWDKQGRREAREGTAAYPLFDEAAVLLSHLKLVIHNAKYEDICR